MGWLAFSSSDHEWNADIQPRRCKIIRTVSAHPFLQLVASLERLLQQPAATPGRAALAALRQSQTEEVPAPAGWGSSGVVPTDPASPPNFSAGGGASGGRSAVTTLGSEAASPSLAAAPTNRWRFAAERAASFRRPPAAAGAVAGGSSAGSGRAVSRLRLDSSTLRHASPAADLLAEIEQAVSPTASPAAVVGLSLSAAASPSFSYQLDAAAAASPAGSSLPHPASPAAAWQQQAAAAGGQPAVTSRWKAAVTSGGSPGAASPQLAAYAFSAQPAGAFAQEASKVLEELQQFAGLERRSEADFAARVGEEMGRIFALPAGGC